MTSLAYPISVADWSISVIGSLFKHHSSYNHINYWLYYNILHMSVHNTTKNKRKAVALTAAALTSIYSTASFIPLLDILAASDEASIRLYRTEAAYAASIRLSRSVHCSYYSSLADTAAASLSSSSEVILLMKLLNCQFLRIWSNLRYEDSIWSFNNFFRLQSEMILFSGHQSEICLFRLPVWNEFESIWSNLKSEEAIWIFCASLKPVWN